MYQGTYILREFGRQVRELRKGEGLTQEKLAHSLGYRRNSSVSRLETGKELLPPAKMEQLLDTLPFPQESVAMVRAVFGVDIPSWDAVKVLYEQAEEAYHQMQSDRSLELLSTVVASLGRYSSQSQWNSESRRLAINSYDLLGDVFRIRNDQDLAMTMFAEALEHAERLGDSFQVARALSGLGITRKVRAGGVVIGGKYVRSEMEKAAECLERALAALQTSRESRERSDRQRADIQTNLVVVYSVLGIEERASELYRSTSSIVNSYQNSRQGAEWATWMSQVIRKHNGKALLQRGCYSEAEDFLLEALDISKSERDGRFRLSQVSTEIALCDLHLSKGEIDKALECRDEVLQIAARYGFRHQEEKLKEVLLGHSTILSRAEVAV